MGHGWMDKERSVNGRRETRTERKGEGERVDAFVEDCWGARAVQVTAGRGVSEGQRRNVGYGKGAAAAGRVMAYRERERERERRGVRSKGRAGYG